jgi:hypothetical protein
VIGFFEGVVASNKMLPGLLFIKRGKAELFHPFLEPHEARAVKLFLATAGSFLTAPDIA